MISDDPTDIVFVAKLPRAVLIARKESVGIFISDFHVFDACRNACLVNSLYEFIGEFMVVHKPPVTDGTVQRLDLLIV